MNINYRFLREKKADELELWHSKPLEKKIILEKQQYNNATILPIKSKEQLLFGQGGVIDEEKQYIPMSGIEWRIWGDYEYSVNEIKNEKVVYCGYLVPHWGHFLIEAVTRLWYFFENDETVDKYVFMVELNSTRKAEGNYKEFLELLGVYPKVEIINVPTRYREVIIPEVSYSMTKFYSEYYKKLFEVVANNACRDKNSSYLKNKIFFKE